MISERRPGWRTGLAAALVSIPLACLPSMAGAADTDLASGPGWDVTQAPGGYLVTVDLDKKLPIVSDAPTIEVDGVPIGLATESADGTSLSVFTTDAAVIAADERRGRLVQQPDERPQDLQLLGQGGRPGDGRRRGPRCEPLVAGQAGVHRGGLQLRRPVRPAGRHRRHPR